MPLTLLHAGRTNPGLSAALDLRFALDKSLTAYRGPTPSFSRASTGSYFDGSGVLRYAALNVLTYSEDFTNAVWTKTNATITANAILSPDGKLTADKISEDSASAKHRAYVTPSVTVGTIYTFSVYAKSAERNWLAMNYADTNANMYAYFNLQNGTIGSIDPSLTALITSVGNGWYRCSVTKTLAAAGPNFDVGPTTGDGVFSYAGTIGSGIYIWGAQLEASSTVGTYCPTTSSANSAPRFDHTFNGTSWVSRGLLVEEQRTNTILYSIDASFPNWNPTNTSKTLVNAPNGTVLAARVTGTSSTPNPKRIETDALSPVTTGIITGSIYAKAGTHSIIQIMYSGYGGANIPYANYNLADGTVGTFGGQDSSAKIESIGNGWFRCSHTFTMPSSTQIYAILVSLQDSTTALRGANSTSTGYSDVWGAQIEQGSFVTSLIPTTSASVTRSADVCQITGTDFSGFWNGTEGSLVLEYDRLAAITSGFSGGYPRYLTVDDGTLNNRMGLLGYTGSPSNEAFYAVTGGSSQGDTLIGASAAGGISQKIGFAYKANDAAASLNGASVVADSTFAVPIVTKMQIGYYDQATTSPINGHIARLRYYRKRLPNETLQLLSEPDPTLNLQFALNKTLTPVAGPAPSFSRASTGTYFNASGVLTSASINTPRFDHVYSGNQWVSRGLLVEEQRTNSFRYSEDFSNAIWYKRNMSITANNAVAPDGTTTADKAIPTGSFPDFYFNSAFNPGSTATLSIFAKAAGYNTVRLQYDLGQSAIFDLSTATVTGINGSSTGKIENVGNGWYRLILTSTSVSFNNYPIFAIDGVSGDGSSGVLFWGAQSEAGAFATSYIPSTGSSSTTRSADVCQITGTSFGSMWNQGEGSVVAEYDRLFSASSISNASTVFQAFIDGNNNDRYALFHNSSGTVGERFNVTVGNAEYANLDSGVSVSQLIGRASSAYKLNDFALTVNGGSIVSDTSGLVVSNADKLNIGRMYSSNWLNGHIAKLIYYPARLTNTKLQQLST